MWRYRSPITVRRDYILGTDCRDFYDVSIREPRSLRDHMMILAELKGDGESRNFNYCKGGTTWHIADPKRGPIQEEDAIFEEL